MKIIKRQEARNLLKKWEGYKNLPIKGRMILRCGTIMMEALYNNNGVIEYDSIITITATPTELDNFCVR